MEKELTIQQVAAMTHLSEHTLRYYERIGLLTAIDRDNNGYRRYSMSDVTRIEFLRCLRSTGMPIQKMQRYMELLHQGQQTANERRLLLVAHHQEVQAHITESQHYLEMITRKIASYETLAQERTAHSAADSRIEEL